MLQNTRINHILADLVRRGAIVCSSRDHSGLSIAAVATWVDLKMMRPSLSSYGTSNNRTVVAITTQDFPCELKPNKSTEKDVQTHAALGTSASTALNPKTFDPGPDP